VTTGASKNKLSFNTRTVILSTLIAFRVYQTFSLELAGRHWWCTRLVCWKTFTQSL